MLGLGNIEEAHQLLNQALAKAEMIGEHSTLWKVQASLADINEQLDNMAGAERFRGQAQSTVETIVTHTPKGELRDSFLALAGVQFEPWR